MNVILTYICTWIFVKKNVSRHQGFDGLYDVTFWLVISISSILVLPEGPLYWAPRFRETETFHEIENTVTQSRVVNIIGEKIRNGLNEFNNAIYYQAKYIPSLNLFKPLWLFSPANFLDGRTSDCSINYRCLQESKKLWKVAKLVSHIFTEMSALFHLKMRILFSGFLK